MFAVRQVRIFLSTSNSKINEHVNTSIWMHPNPFTYNLSTFPLPCSAVYLLYD